jgi:hypothetical protein
MIPNQFDVYANPDPETAATHPYFIVLQSNALRDLDTVVVAPLVAPRKIRFLERLLPEVVVKGAHYVIAMPDLGTIPKRLVSMPVANLEAYRYQIIGAVDVVFSGF